MSARRVDGAVGGAGFGEALAPLGAFVAATAMLPADRRDAGEGVLEREPPPQLEHLGLGQSGERRLDAELVAKGRARQAGEAREELRTAVGERVAQQCPEGDRV